MSCSEKREISSSARRTRTSSCSGLRLPALFLVATCAGPQRPDQDDGRNVAALVLAQVGGGYVDLAELRGRPAMLFFFTTYSAPAQAIAPFVAQVARRHARDGLIVVGVALEPGSEAIVRAWRDYMSPPYPLAIADADVVAGRSPLGPIPAVPSLAFLDRSGRVAGWEVRLVDERQLERIVTELLQN